MHLKYRVFKKKRHYRFLWEKDSFVYVNINDKLGKRLTLDCYKVLKWMSGYFSGPFSEPSNAPLHSFQVDCSTSSVVMGCARPSQNSMKFGMQSDYDESSPNWRFLQQARAEIQGFKLASKEKMAHSVSAFQLSTKTFCQSSKFKSPYLCLHLL